MKRNDPTNLTPQRLRTLPLPLYRRALIDSSVLTRLLTPPSRIPDGLARSGFGCGGCPESIRFDSLVVLSFLLTTFRNFVLAEEVGEEW